MSITSFLLLRIARVGAWPLLKRVRRFQESCADPRAVQDRLLRDILARQANTGFGKDHGFAAIRTVEDYRRQVPVCPYESLSPYIERVKAGETTALLADDRLRFFALTSGTTAARKFIPVTDRYLADLRRAWTMWGVRAYRDHRPRYLPLRPIVQMVGDPDEFRTPSGVPCGNLSGFTASIQKRIVRRQYVVPPLVGKIKDPMARYYVALRFSLGKPVALFLSANPSTLINLARTLNDYSDQLLRDLHNGTLDPRLEMPPNVRARLTARLTCNPGAVRVLSRRADRLGRLYPMDVWGEDYTLVGCWTGGSMGPYLRQVPTYYGHAPIRDLGLVASEGRFTIPFSDATPSGVLDISSHYFEFVPEAEMDSACPTVLGAHELELGKTYFLLPTTAAGLYRYHISDLVRVTGYLGRTPTVEFVGKGHRFSNLTGEKISEHHVTRAMDAAAADTGVSVTGYVVAPVWDDRRPYYAAFVEESDATDEGRLRSLLAAFEQRLAAGNSEYEAKRESGRLGPVRAALIPHGALAAFDRERLARTGGSPEQYKRPCLVGDIEFAKTMPVLREVG